MCVCVCVWEGCVLRGVRGADDMPTGLEHATVAIAGGDFDANIQVDDELSARRRESGTRKRAVRLT